MATAATKSAPTDLEGADALEIIEYAVREYHPRLYLACSFQQEESVLIDMLLSVEPGARIFALDTGVLFEETYETWEQFEQHFDTKIERYAGISLEQQATQYGEALWEREPSSCCNIRKVEPLKRALGEVDAWITGVRREQSPTRADAPKFGWDGALGLWKFNPLADWDQKRIWSYITEHNLPYNKLHDQGYSSIGCTHCTQPGEGREGRWSGNDKTECGLHLDTDTESK